MNNGAPARLSQRVQARIVAAIDAWLEEPAAIEASLAAIKDRLSRRVAGLVEGALAAGNSYRDGMMIQLAWGFEESGFDHTQKGEGARSAAGAIAKALAARHIPAVKDAYQNIGKNTANLARGNVPAFDDLLRWMNSASDAERQAAFDLVTATAALTARPVLPMPELARASLTFSKVVAVLDELLAVPSGGAHEQFAVAAFLEALIDEFGLTGVGSLSVRTKNINASDASAGTAADVQVLRGNRVEEAFEVSASGWRDKLDQAILAAKNADLNRIHILSHVQEVEGLGELLKGTTTDVTVIDIKTFLRTLAAVLKKPGREVALMRLYEHLDRKQPDTARVNAFVELLRRHSLAA